MPLRTPFLPGLSSSSPHSRQKRHAGVRFRYCSLSPYVGKLEAIRPCCYPTVSCSTFRIAVQCVRSTLVLASCCCKTRAESFVAKFSRRNWSCLGEMKTFTISTVAVAFAHVRVLQQAPERSARSRGTGECLLARMRVCVERLGAPIRLLAGGLTKACVICN